MIYYIDPTNGTAGADGLTPEKARTTYTDLSVRPGDTVLFRRGSFIRDRLYRTEGAPGRPVTYGAYGEGENPVFCGSVDVSDPEKWTELRPNVWKYTGSLPSEACNFIYDNGRIGATLRWNEHELCAQGDWYDDRMGGQGRYAPDAEEKVLLWSEGNPGKVYSHIECALWGGRDMSTNRSWTILEDLCFVNSGVHGLTMGADHVTVRRCSFCFIGGAVWNRQLQIRFGNAIEFWDHCEDVLIEDCYFNNIYDSCMTHQGTANCEPARNLVMRNNLCMHYGMGAYEGRDRMNIDSVFNDNICVNAGGGFTGFGDTRPRKSEIYPQPMGHHLFLWRIKAPTENGGLEVARNLFYHAEGTAMYSIIDPDAEKQIHLHDNRYYTDNRNMFQYIGKTFYKPEAFDRYLTEWGEEGAVYEKFDIDAAIDDWFVRTGCSSYGAQRYTDTLPAQKYFIGTTEKDALSYGIGEDICFRITLTEEGVPTACGWFSYECWGDDGMHDKGIVSGESGMFEYHTSLSAPGYVKMYVYVSDENREKLPGYDTFEGGACVEFDKIGKIGGEPADYDAYWARVIREELDPVPPDELRREEFRCGDPGDIVYDIKVACPGPAPVSGYLRLPRNAADRSLPIEVTYMGYSVTSAEIPNKGNAIQLCLNQHGTENGRPWAYYEDLMQTTYANFGFDREENKNPDTVYFKYMILRALQAVRYCRNLPQWDGVNVIVKGGSMGGFQAAMVASLDKGVTGLDLLVPWMCDTRGTEAGRLGGWRPEGADGLDYYDTVTAARRVTCPTVISAGLGDYVCPPSGITVLYHHLAGPKKLEMLQNRTHGYTAPEYSVYTKEN